MSDQFPDERVLKPKVAKVACKKTFEEGLEHSCVPALCISANAFGSDWAQLEVATLRCRDPLNTKRRFMPLRLDNAPIKGFLAQFLYINWLPAAREQKSFTPRKSPVAIGVFQQKGCLPKLLSVGGDQGT
jgi:hypothetical protein